PGRAWRRSSRVDGAIACECVRPEPQLELSVVIAVSDSAAAVEATLADLGLQSGADRCEVIVATARDRVGTGLAQSVSGVVPFRRVSWVVAPAGTGVPRLRRLGLDRASAPVVAFTEDSCRFAQGWVRAWVAAFAEPGVQAATGPVEAAMG